MKKVFLTFILMLATFFLSYGQLDNNDDDGTRFTLEDEESINKLGFNYSDLVQTYSVNNELSLNMMWKEKRSFQRGRYLIFTKCEKGITDQWLKVYDQTDVSAGDIYSPKATSVQGSWRNRWVYFCVSNSYTGIITMEIAKAMSETSTYSGKMYVFYKSADPNCK